MTSRERWWLIENKHDGVHFSHAQKHLTLTWNTIASLVQSICPPAEHPETVRLAPNATGVLAAGVLAIRIDGARSPIRLPLETLRYAFDSRPQ